MKVYKTIEQQLQLLKARNVIIPSTKYAHKILAYENYYYVINGYKDPFLSTTDPNDYYKTGTTFTEIVSLYSFDRTIRELLSPELLRIEHNIKTRVVDVFSLNHGYDHREYLTPSCFNTAGKTNTQRVNYLIDDMNRLIISNQKKHNAVRHYIKKHGYVPLWVLSTIMTFGKLNSFYGCMLRKEKQDISSYFRLPESDFRPIIEYLSTFRNKCAHSERLYSHSKDQIFPRPIPILPEHELLGIPMNKKGYKYGTKDILALLICMRHFMHQHRYNKLLARIDYALNVKLKSHLHTISVSNIASIMGLVGDWKKALTALDNVDTVISRDCH